MKIPTKQICAWVDEPGPGAKLDIKETDVPRPGSGKVLVQLELTGVWYVRTLNFAFCGLTRASVATQIVTPSMAVRL